ncbi:hypothetical protein JCGZ_01638 [Jatropha curcas]|uniref:Uncharacterized protein n=1 Tax=Jatropha curcas TaxID=180498 RepID=A0A067LE11_JATCU|nr:hypothetical protein JCGZ_01638 [Jatropha curcas]
MEAHRALYGIGSLAHLGVSVRHPDERPQEGVSAHWRTASILELVSPPLEVGCLWRRYYDMFNRLIVVVIQILVFNQFISHGSQGERD